MSEMNNVVELVLFKLKSGMDVKEFKEASEQFAKKFIDKQSGLVSRVLVATDDGGWGDLAIWESMEFAKAVEVAMQQCPEAGTYNSFINPASIEMKHFIVQ